MLLQSVKDFHISPMHGRARHVAEEMSMKSSDACQIHTAVIKRDHENHKHVLLWTVKDFRINPMYRARHVAKEGSGEEL